MHKTFSIQKSSYNKRALRHFCGSGVPPDFLTTTGSMGEDAHATLSTRMAENRKKYVKTKGSKVVGQLDDN